MEKEKAEKILKIAKTAGKIVTTLSKILLVLLVIAGSGFIGAGAHMIFRVPEPLPIIPPCPTCETCPEVAEVAECPEVAETPKSESAWYAQLWDAVTPGNATAEIPPAVVTKYQKLTPTIVPATKITITPPVAAPPPEPRSLFKIWWEDTFQTWLSKTFGWKEQITTITKETTVVVQTTLSNDTKELLNKNMARIVELTAKMTDKKMNVKNRKGIQKRINFHIETIVALIEKDDGKKVAPIIDLDSKPKKPVAPKG